MKGYILTFLAFSITFLIGFETSIANQLEYEDVEEDDRLLDFFPEPNAQYPSYSIKSILPNGALPAVVRVPTAVGTYTNGALRDGIKIANEGIGYVKVLRGNGSDYGTHFLISTIEYVTSEMRDRYPNYPRLEITALSKKNGGYAHGHDSHQNGLDMDAIYLHKRGIDRNSSTRLNGSEPNDSTEFVQNGAVSSNIDLERNFQLMHLFVSTGRVNAIFTDRSIKAALCNYAKDSGIPGFENTLSKLHHWPRHKTHFHLRLECPKSSRGCLSTKPSNIELGCVTNSAIRRGGRRIKH